jgi:hypothetical protein
MGERRLLAPRRDDDRRLSRRSIRHIIHRTEVLGPVAVPASQAVKPQHSSRQLDGRYSRMPTITTRGIRYACDYFVLVNHSSIFRSVGKL